MVAGALLLAVVATGCKTQRGTIVPLQNQAHRLPPPPENPVTDTQSSQIRNLGGNNGSGRNGIDPNAGNRNQVIPRSNPLNDGSGNGSQNHVQPIVQKPIDTPVDPLTNLHPPTKGHDGWIHDTIVCAQYTVYFDFDKSSIKAGEESKVSAVADYLKTHTEVAVLVEGNCDERGTEEYNRSLGERRALATREILIRLGIDASRIDTITYGVDRPAVQGHNEAAWSKNRRDDFVVLTMPKP